MSRCDGHSTVQRTQTLRLPVCSIKRNSLVTMLWIVTIKDTQEAVGFLIYLTFLYIFIFWSFMPPSMATGHLSALKCRHSSKQSLLYTGQGMDFSICFSSVLEAASSPTINRESLPGGGRHSCHSIHNWVGGAAVLCNLLACSMFARG